MENLEEIKNKLIQQGYNATIPAGANYVCVLGYLRNRYFNAKQRKAKTILETLTYLGYKAKTEKCMDGYFDFYVYGLIDKTENS